MKPNCLLRFYLLQASAALILLRRRSLCGTGALALILSASTAQAAVSITGNYGGATAPTINSTYGTLEFALNMGGSALTRDEVAFTAAGTSNTGNGGSTRTFLTSGGVGTTINVVGVTQGGNRAWSQATLSGSTDALFHTIAFANHNSSPGYEITVSGLDAGKSYQLQFLFGDPRTSYPYSNTVTAFDSSSNTDTATVSYGSSSPTDQFAMLTAVVSGSTSFRFQSFKGASGGGPGIAGLVVHSVPEPSAALLGGLGLLALLRRRRA
jgi:MYXO-CTERM domain-containing protein